jgi:hypothetical protein
MEGAREALRLDVEVFGDVIRKSLKYASMLRLCQSHKNRARRPDMHRIRTPRSAATDTSYSIIQHRDATRKKDHRTALDTVMTFTAQFFDAHFSCRIPTDKERVVGEESSISVKSLMPVSMRPRP